MLHHLVEYILKEIDTIDLIDFSLVSKDWYYIVSNELKRRCSLLDQYSKMDINLRRDYETWRKKGIIVEKLFVPEMMMIFKLYEYHDTKNKKQTFDFVVETMHQKHFLLHRYGSDYYEKLDDVSIQFYARVLNVISEKIENCIHLCNAK